MDAYLAKGSGPGNPPELSAVLVISSLVTLIEEQAKKLNSKNLSALHLDMSGNYRETKLQGGRAILKSRAFNSA